MELDKKYEGTVIYYNREKHFGKIKCKENDDVFIHDSSLIDKSRRIRVNDIVHFEVRPSQKRADSFEAINVHFIQNQLWDSFLKNIQNETQILKGKIVGFNQGGYIIEIDKFDIFLPKSLSGFPLHCEPKDFVNQIIDFKIISHDANNIVVSRKAITDEEGAKKRMDFFSNIKQNQILKGRITKFMPYGIFIDFGFNIRGLLHRQEVSWTYLEDLSKQFTIDQEIEVIILEIDYDEKKLILGYKQLHPHPWEKVKNLHVGAQISGTISLFTRNNAPLKITILNDIVGLFHLKNIVENRKSFATIEKNHPEKLQEIFNLYGKLNLKIIDIDFAKKYIVFDWLIDNDAEFLRALKFVELCKNTPFSQTVIAKINERCTPLYKLKLWIKDITTEFNFDYFKIYSFPLSKAEASIF